MARCGLRWNTYEYPGQGKIPHEAAAGNQPASYKSASITGGVKIISVVVSTDSQNTFAVNPTLGANESWMTKKLRYKQ